jgi:hypothetical protein
MHIGGIRAKRVTVGSSQRNTVLLILPNLLARPAIPGVPFGTCSCSRGAGRKASTRVDTVADDTHQVMFDSGPVQ